MSRYVLFSVGVFTLGRLPIRVLYMLAAIAARLAYLLARGPRESVRDNLRHVAPEASASQIDRWARGVFRNVTFYYADLFHMPHMDLDEFFQRRFVFHGFHEHVVPAVKEGKGVVLLSAHSGNPELAIQGLIPMGVKTLALTEPLQPLRLSRLVDRLRAAHGHTFAPVGLRGVKKVMQTLRQGGVVALMGDRDIEGPKALLPFFGVETLMPTGPLEVALRTGSPAIPCFNRRNPDGSIEAFIEEPLPIERTGDLERDAREGTLLYLRRLERFLRKEPGQWAVLERVWDGQPAAAKEAVAAGKK